MYSRDQVEKSIKKLLVSELGIPADKVRECTAETPLLGRGLGINSIETLAIVVGLEEEFDMQVDDDDLHERLFVSIGTLADFVCAQLDGKQQAVVGG